MQDYIRRKETVRDEDAPTARPENGRAVGWLSGGANLCGARALLAGLDLELDALPANEAVEVQ